MKKLISLILALSMILTFIPSAFAAERDFSREESLATRLKALGLFKGVSETDFALDRAPTRVEALVMLIRLLGKEDTALNTTETHPFTDVPAWADKYVAYAYGGGLTNGISATKFGGQNAASAEMYLTFVLRALGYSDGEGGDFLWNAPYGIANEAGLLKGKPDCDNFLRADVVLISYAALGVHLKESEFTLGKVLIDAGVFTIDAFNQNFDATLVGGGLKLEDELVIGESDAYEELLSFLASKKAGMGSLANSFAGYFIAAPDSSTGNIYTLSYLDDTEEFLAMCTFDLLERKITHVATVTFKKDSPDVVIKYIARDFETSEELVSATQTLKKTDITLQLKLDSFNAEINESIASADTKENISANMSFGALYALAFVNNLMTNSVSGGDLNIADLGFTNLKFE